jgi:RimJ/RimL family protein N-acetyltransferase
MSYFASTARLQIRSQRESDTDRLFALLNDPSVQRSGPANVVPKGPEFRKAIIDFPDSALITFVLDVKASELPDHDRSALEGFDDEAKRDDALFVGYVTLKKPAFPKNRDSELAIALTGRWRGRGYGREVMTWLLDYGFDQLALHRVTLHVMEGNDRAISLYNKL